MTGCPQEIKEQLGLVQVYTGNGKGKTTTALGLALRATGRGLNVIMIQFLKPDGDYGEQVAGRRMQGFTILPMGADHLSGRVDPETEKRLTAEAMAKSEEVLVSGGYDLVILDEVNNSMRFGLVKADELIAMLERRAPNTEVVLTGRGAPDEIIEYADLVTEMRLVKHPFDRGVPARKGIEF
ncbi:MAG: cob(I)yrinic acid a,c-diamide adenosyltransferase [Thermoplasmata archaeon]|nr:cob(I)yrinic acid a,c-diamide adenosyltransferase [Thermoplasmata archaeon]